MEEYRGPKTRESCRKLQNLPKTLHPFLLANLGHQPFLLTSLALALQVTLECFLAKGDLRYLSSLPLPVQRREGYVERLREVMNSVNCERPSPQNYNTKDY